VIPAFPRCEAEVTGKRGSPCISAKYRDSTLRIDLGSSRSPSAVDPVTSAGASTLAPHSEQNFAPSAFPYPQFDQTATGEVQARL